MKDSSSIIVIGIAGGTGSGKTTITRKIMQHFGGNVSVIYHDNYYKAHHGMSFEERTKLNYDHPDAFDTELLIEDLKKLRRGEAMTALLKERLSTYLIENKDAAGKIAEQVLINKRSRENAEKTRQSIKTNLQQKTDMANRVQKFIDCRSKDKSRREVYIVEGDSAAGAIRTSRDAEFQGVMPVRGKILNCLKEDYPRIFKSDIIMDLMRVLGCGVEIKDKRIKNLGSFDLDNLRWNKVIICTDADVDGYHIRTLVLTMLYRLVPTLIKEGYVYIAESPLYEINCKEKTYFAYTELEKNDVLKQIGDQKCSINRSKGLGENDPDMMWLTTMNPETRRLIKVEPEDVERMETMFNLLLGNDEAGRKRHISEHGKEYLDQLDLQ